MPTIIGIVFFICGLFCFFFQEERLFGLLILATVFEAASAVNIAERGIQPYYVVAFFIIARAAVNRLLGGRASRPVPQGVWLFSFCLVCVVSAIFYPRIFAGMPIYDPQLGIDDGLFIHPPLAPKLSNAVQAAYLSMHVATAFSLPALRFSVRKTGRALLWAFYVEVAFLAAESVSQLVGVSFPLSIVLNNPGYGLWSRADEFAGIRNPGTFAEPSLAGAFILIFFVSFLFQYFEGRGSPLKPLTALLAVGLVASSSTLVLAALTPLGLLVRFSPFRFPLRVDTKRLKRAAWILVPSILLTVVPLLLFASFQGVLAEATVGKAESGSFINRTASDLFGIQLLLQTMGVGVGFGSSRSSSLLVTLLSNIGLAGTGAFLVFYYRLYASLPQAFTWLKWAGFALLLNLCLGLADVTMPLVWIPILLAIQLSVYGSSTGNTLPPKSWPSLTAEAVRHGVASAMRKSGDQGENRCV